MKVKSYPTDHLLHGNTNSMLEPIAAFKPIIEQIARSAEHEGLECRAEKK